MSDYSELERRAQAAIDAIGTLSRARQEREFNDVCTPQVVKALIAENKVLTKMFADAPDLPDTDVEWLEKTRLLEAERDRLRAEVAGLKTGYEAYERVNAELKAECEALRKDAERYRWLREYNKPESEAPFICQQRLMFGKLYYAGPLVARALDQEVDSAMGKGDRP